MKKTARPLSLRRETVRTLDAPQLASAHGGDLYISTVICDDLADRLINIPINPPTGSNMPTGTCGSGSIIRTSGTIIP
jgi:hypothetical protein